MKTFFTFLNSKLCYLESFVKLRVSICMIAEFRIIREEIMALTLHIKYTMLPVFHEAFTQQIIY